MRNTLLLLFVCFALPAFAVNSVGLEDAIAQGLISVKAVGEGGYTGKVMALEISSLHKKDLVVDIPAGLQLNSEDSTIQDLIITDTRQLELAAGSKRRLIINAMCIQPRNGSPYASSAFIIGAMANDTLVKLAQYLATKGYQDDLGQSAIWAMVNNEGLENVYGNDPTRLQDLLQFMHELTGKPIPWYNKEKAAPPTGQVYTQEPAIIHANFEFKLAMAGTARIAIYDEAGNLVYVIKDNMMVKSGKSTMKFRIEVRGYEEGKYYVRLELNGKLQEEKVFEL
jgi:hypothetical protein